MTTPTILLVDDTPSFLNALHTIFVEENYHVFTATDGMEAMRIIKENQSEIHLVITNIKMPKMDGIELIEQMPGILQMPMSVIILSAIGGEVNRQHLKLGVGEHVMLYDVIQKPPPMQHLLNSVKEATDLCFTRRKAFIDKDMTMYLCYN